MPVFTQQLRPINANNPAEALKAMANHIKYIQEQLEYTLQNLDSSNVIELDTEQTNITSSSGSVDFTGDSITLRGKNGEVFDAGIGDNGVFQFYLKGRNGEQVFYLTSTGEFVITNKATITIDGGEW